MNVCAAEQNTDQWLADRIGKPTASAANRVITGTGARSSSLQKYAEYLAGCRFAGFDIEAWNGNQYTARGHEVEPESRAAYELEFDCDVEKVGFCTTDDGRYGASPDGLLNDRKGGLEIKSLPKAHISTLLYWNKHKRCPPEYVPQAQMQILVCDLDWVDSYFYQPGLPSLRIRHFLDTDFQRSLRMFLAELIAKRDEIEKILRGL